MNQFNFDRLRKPAMVMGVAAASMLPAACGRDSQEQPKPVPAHRVGATARQFARMFHQIDARPTLYGGKIIKGRVNEPGPAAPAAPSAPTPTKSNNPSNGILKPGNTGYIKGPGKPHAGPAAGGGSMLEQQPAGAAQSGSPRPSHRQPAREYERTIEIPARGHEGEYFLSVYLDKRSGSHHAHFAGISIDSYPSGPNSTSAYSADLTKEHGDWELEVGYGSGPDSGRYKTFTTGSPGIDKETLTANEFEALEADMERVAWKALLRLPVRELTPPSFVDE